MDTDSSTTARVDDPETLKRDGATLGAANVSNHAPHAASTILALAIDDSFRNANARILIQ
jgi:hypothetical protein